MKNAKKVGVTDFVSEIKRAENSPNFERSVRVSSARDLDKYVAETSDFSIVSFRLYMHM